MLLPQTFAPDEEELIQISNIEVFPAAHLEASNEILLAARIGIVAKYILIELRIDLLECHFILPDLLLPNLVIELIFSLRRLLHDHLVLHLLQNCCHTGQKIDSLLDVFVFDEDLALAFGRYHSLEHLCLVSVASRASDNSQQEQGVDADFVGSSLDL